MTVERLHNGGIQVYAIINGHLVRRMYFGYTSKQAMSLFKEELLK